MDTSGPRASLPHTSGMLGTSVPHTHTPERPARAEHSPCHGHPIPPARAGFRPRVFPSSYSMHAAAGDTNTRQRTAGGLCRGRLCDFVDARSARRGHSCAGATRLLVSPGPARTPERLKEANGGRDLAFGGDAPCGGEKERRLICFACVRRETGCLRGARVDMHSGDAQHNAMKWRLRCSWEDDLSMSVLGAIKQQRYRIRCISAAGASQRRMQEGASGRQEACER